MTVREVEQRFDDVIAQVEAGEEILVRRGEVPVARIVPVRAVHRTRVAGRLAGQIVIGPDFDEIPPGFNG